MNSGKIGIDLGTTYSCCGIFKNGAVELIPYNEGTKTIPSHVYYNPKTPEITIGNAAKNNPKAIGHDVFDSKRFIGRYFDDPEIQEDIKHWPFKVIKGENNEPIVELEHNCKMIHLTANDISTEILKKIKTTADTFIGQDTNLPTEAVITVPAYFNNQQRQNTIEAAKNANLKVIKIINEPTAAAIAYAYQRIEEVSKNLTKGKDEEILLIYDFGGGTFDVSIIKINFKTRVITVIATDGDSHLGGEDVDQRLVDLILKRYKKSVKPEKMFKLKKKCEDAKCLLSSEGNTEAIVEWEALEDDDIDAIITRAQFDIINELERGDKEDLKLYEVKEIEDRNMKKIYSSTMTIVDNVLSASGLSSKDIDFLVLVGGSSRIPKVQELLRNKFPPTTTICKDINPDEVVANGACLYANLENDKEKSYKIIEKVQDIITHTISTDVEENGKTVLYPLIKKNTAIPYTSAKPISFANAEDGADHIDISVFEGEGRYPTDKGVKELKSVPFKIPKKDVEAASYIIDTVYKVDENGVLTIEVKDRQTNETTNLKIELK